MKDGLTPPDLIIIDGGQGQVNVACDVIENKLGLDIPIAGLQKNDKHQTHELLFGDPLEVVELPRNSEEFSSYSVSKTKFTDLPLLSTVNSVLKIHSHQNSMALLGLAQSASNYS